MSHSSRSAAIPPSPTSPPESGLKRRRLSDLLPQSPISPSLMSVATKSYVSPYGNTQHTDEASGRSSPRSPRSAPSRAPQSASRLTPSLPTPAHSVTGIPGLDMADDVDHHRDKRPRLDSARDEEGDQMDLESPTQATNHDRNNAMDIDGSRQGYAQASQVEKRRGTSDQPVAGGFRMGATTLEQLQEDMGEAFLLGRSSKTFPPPVTHHFCLQVY